MKNKSAELFLSGLGKLLPLVLKVENLEDIYNSSREKVLSEELFWSEDKDEVYNIMRENDVASSDLIRGLRKELDELLNLALTVTINYSSLDLTNKEEK